jgi:adenine-specific DNA-methyltransferase
MTELTWEGKYKEGKKVAPVRIALPFQTIETINESAADRLKRVSSLFNQKQEAGEWRNRLIWGDKKYVLPSLLPEFAGKVNLIYIDPPFNVGADFSFTAKIGGYQETEEDDTISFVKEPSILEQKAYRDTWGRGLDSYAQWFYETIVILRELLSENGTIYIHLDWHISHYAKAILDEVFTYDRFFGEVIWQRSTTVGSSKAIAKKFPVLHDTIFIYSKSQDYIFNKQFTPPSEEYKARFNQEDKNGWYYWNTLATYSQETYERLEKQGRVRWTKGAKFPQYKTYLHELKGNVLSSVWTDINMLNPMAQERVGYETQKPEGLLERIIKTSSNEDDLVLDCFCGSGTTAVAAEKLNRRWITCDLGRFAIHTARKRMLGITDVKPFIVQNLGKYERQQWIQHEFDKPNNRLQQEKAYKEFIAELYHATPLEGYTWLHGAKAGRMIHVGSVETPVTVDDIKASIIEFWKLVGKEKKVATNGIDFLGWDFAFDVNETAAQFAKSNKVDVKFKKIPREVLEKKAVEQGDIKFYELASVNVKTKTVKTQLTITLDNFIIPPDDIPEEIRTSISHWSQWIDYWSIDWNYQDDTFHNEWQNYRTKQNPKIELTASNQYEQKGKFTVLVKVIDILGNDTTKALQIQI